MELLFLWATALVLCFFLFFNQPPFRFFLAFHLWIVLVYTALDLRLVLQMVRGDRHCLYLHPLLGFERELSTGFYPEVAFEFVLQLLLVFRINWSRFGLALVLVWLSPHVKWCCSTRNIIIDFAVYILNNTLVPHTLHIECLLSRSPISKGNTFTSLSM